MVSATQMAGGGLRGVAWVCAVALAFGGCGDDPRPASDADAADTRADAWDAWDAADGAVDALGDAESDAVTDALEEDTRPPDVDADSDTADADTDVADADADDAGADTAEVDGADPDVVDVVDVADGDDVADTEVAADTEVVDDLDTLDDEASAAGPFDDLAGLTGAELRAALLPRISGQTPLGYSANGLAREVMWAVIDVHGGRLECIYTGRTVAGEDPTAPPLGTAVAPAIDTTPNQDCRMPDGTAVPGGCVFNAEHSWPRSQGADSGPAESDLHHLFPAYDMANNRRSNYAFGVTTCVANACEWAENGSELGARDDGTKVFEVRLRYRGDIARAQFYFAVRYQKAIAAPVEATLRAWHADDPPDDEERARNDAIEGWQHNRNPFVDRPDFVAAIADF